MGATVRKISDDERLWVKAMKDYYTFEHKNPRVVTLLEHILNVGILSNTKPASGYMKEYFAFVKLGNDTNSISGSTEWLNKRRESIIKKYKDSDTLKRYYKFYKNL